MADEKSSTFAFVFPATWKLLHSNLKCTNLHNFSAIEPCGILRASCVIRHIALQFQTSPGLETFRIEICSISGSTDVPVVETTPKFIQSLCYHLLLTSISHFDVTSALVMICVGAVIVCAVALMFPTERLDVSTMIPDWLHISVHLKLVFAYISGLITLVLLRPG
uniref:Uncharacterized protein n=1 Tax=Wuchereria bancrofti TaxID=6293 RepID=A0AAF5PJN9_WUCBA